MIKKFSALFLIVLMFFNITASANDIVNNEGKIIFRYSEVQNPDVYIPSDKNLEEGKEYELSVFLNAIKGLSTFALPIHFNNEVVEIISYTTGEAAADGLYKLINLNNGSSGIFLEPNFIYYDWEGGNVTVTSAYPYVSNSQGLIGLGFHNDSSTGQDVIKESLIFKIKFRIKSGGAVDFRPATEADDFYIPILPSGFTFMALSQDSAEPTDISEDVEIIIDYNKMAVPRVNGAAISGTVRLEAVNNLTSIYNSGIKISLIQDDIEKFSNLTSADGGFTIEGVTAGTYTVEISRAGALTMTIRNFVVEANTDRKIKDEIIVLVQGDIYVDSSDAISASDLSNILPYIGTVDSSSDYEESMDFDFSGIIDIVDLTLLIKNFDKKAADAYNN